MAELQYQAKAGDAVKKKWLKRTNTFFNTPQEAFTEALALKEKIDKTYDNEIKWDYNGKITGSPEKMNILKGYLGGNMDSKPFCLQIVTLQQEQFEPASPYKPRKVTSEDKKVLKKIIKILN